MLLLAPLAWSSIGQCTSQHAQARHDTLTPRAIHTMQRITLTPQRCSYCYENPSAADPSLGSAGLAQKLKFKLGGADGYFLGLLPSSLCPGLTAGQTAGQAVDVVKLLVNIDFRVASGIQYDRGYMFKIGEAMVSSCGMDHSQIG